ncbi:trypsin-like peptidase domain-containing protein [Streptomyces axinellae]|uniref:vWA-MoxR associated protein C-terminal domain-containing protein n=1 Tax=Streptomyces axinellae TaxID=552788 RepID=A0ABP6C518_9ACTN
MSTARLEALVSRATVWLGPRAVPEAAAGARRRAQETMWGSGFFVAPGWVLTCAHVVTGLPGDDGTGTFAVHGAHGSVPARVGYLLSDAASKAPEQDLALVQVLEDVAHPCVWLTDRCDRPFQVEAHGWRVAEPGAAPQRWSGRCAVSGGDGAHGALLGPEAEIPSGASGGPVLDLDRGAVAGIVKAQRRGKDGGLAVVTTALRGFTGAATTSGGGGLGYDPYRALILAHDRWHDPRVPASSTARREAPAPAAHRPGGGPAGGPGGRLGPRLGTRAGGAPGRFHEQPNSRAPGVSWAAAQETLHRSRTGEGGRDGGDGWSPRDHLTALALLAELPPPGHPSAVAFHVERVLGEESLWMDPAAQHDWRDGHGWLYESPEGEEMAFLHYLSSVAAECAAEAPQKSAVLLDWVDERAQRLPPARRAALRRAAWAAELESDAYAEPGACADPGASAEGDADAYAGPDTNPVPGACAGSGAYTGPGARAGSAASTHSAAHAETSPSMACDPATACDTSAMPNGGTAVPDARAQSRVPCGDRAAPGGPDEPPGAPCPAPREADTRDGGPVVAVELERAIYPRGEGPARDAARFYWRIWTWSEGPESVRAGARRETGQGATRQELPLQLAQPLREAFARVDTDRRRARLELAAPVEHFDIGAHLWRPDLVPRGLRPRPEDRLFGVHRQVVLRDAARVGEPYEEEPDAGRAGYGTPDGSRCPAGEARLAPGGSHLAPGAAWEKRWHAALEGALEALMLHPPQDTEPLVDASERLADASGPLASAHGPHAGTSEPLAGAPDRAVPVLCRTRNGGPDALRDILRAGYGLALWSGHENHPGGCEEEVCGSLLGKAAQLVRDARHAAALPERLRALRERISLGDESAYWAEHMALLYDDPRRPVPRLTDPLDSP